MVHNRYIDCVHAYKLDTTAALSLLVPTDLLLVTLARPKDSRSYAFLKLRYHV